MSSRRRNIPPSAELFNKWVAQFLSICEFTLLNTELRKEVQKPEATEDAAPKPRHGDKAKRRGPLPLPDDLIYELVRILELVQGNEPAQRQLWQFLTLDWPLWLRSNYYPRSTRAKDRLPWRIPPLLGEFERSKLTDLKEVLMRTLTLPLERASHEAKKAHNAHKAHRRRILARIREEGVEAFREPLTSPLLGTVGLS